MRGRHGLLIALGAFAFALTACGGGGGGGNPIPSNAPSPTPTPVATVTPTPTPTPTTPPVPTAWNTSLTCTTAGAPQSAFRRSTAFVSGDRSTARRLAPRNAGSSYATGIVEVEYDRAAYQRSASDVARSNASAGAGEVRTLDFAQTGRVVQILHVAPGTEEAAMRALRSNAGVASVSRSALRYQMSTNAASAFTNDPYFKGFSGTTVPLYELPSIPGQWDMHAICAANAWAYGQPNAFGPVFPAAQGGSASVPIAIVDTGADTSHPELSSRITYGESVLSGTVTPGLSAVTDTDGHGTNVAGIAAASGNNNLGFAGVAYNVPLMIFRVFPNTGCPSSGCTALGSDVGIAINDAVSHGAKVISLSLGASTPDTGEENAVAAAISAGVVVVAASGNETHTSLDYPARDSGVIAVGASALDDSTGTVNEKVASYSNYDAGHATTWGLVAPGGDPSGSTDYDDLHWIENISSSQAPTTSTTCTADYGSPPSGTTDCRTLIAGTSQATPHVAGAAALLLSVKPTLTPANVFTALCTTATAIPGATKAGCGRLNVYRAMASPLVLNDPNP